MATVFVNDEYLTAVADAIRTKGGTSASLVFPQGFVDAIAAIETGGTQGLIFSKAHVYEFTTGAESATMTIPLDLETSPVFAMLMINDTLPVAPSGKIYPLSAIGLHAQKTGEPGTDSLTANITFVRGIYGGSKMTYSFDVGTITFSPSSVLFTITKTVSGYQYLFPPNKKFKVLVCESNFDVPL